MLGTLRKQLTYANVAATLALFAALGGSSYAALKLPRNSVGSSQIRSGAVGSSELRRGAVSSRHVKDRSIRLADISTSARASLRGQAGPPGPAGPTGPSGVTYRAAVDSGGGLLRGNATLSNHQPGSGAYRFNFDRDLSPCVFTATVAKVDATTPAPGLVYVETTGSSVVVHTFNPGGTPEDRPFMVLGAC